MKLYILVIYLVYSLYFNWSLVLGARDEVLKITHGSGGEERKEQYAGGKVREEQKHHKCYHKLWGKLLNSHTRHIKKTQSIVKHGWFAKFKLNVYVNVSWDRVHSSLEIYLDFPIFSEAIPKGILQSQYM